jgi:hypothetical protein
MDTEPADTRTFLKSLGFPDVRVHRSFNLFYLLLAPVLGASYAFLYAALQSEDYALLIGSLGLFVILAGVIILTRQVDWYRPGRAAGNAGRAAGGNEHWARAGVSRPAASEETAP